MIAIIGCGPAGMSAAVLLHDAGYPVKIYEQFHEPGPVGSGLMLQPTGLAVLQQLGWRGQCEALGQRIDRMSGRLAPAGKVVLDIRYGALDPDLYGIAIHRAALFEVLHQAVLGRQIPIVTDTPVADMRVESSQSQTVKLLDSEGGEVASQVELVVDASGAQSKLLAHALHPPQRRPLTYGALWTTVKLEGDVFERNCLEQRYKAASVMAGVLPCGNLPDDTDELATFFWSIKSADYDRWRQGGLERWKAEVCSHWPQLEVLMAQLNDQQQFTQATYSHHTLRKPYGDAIVFIGDAAHATSPQLGQGANMALLDSWALSQALRRRALKRQRLKGLALKGQGLEGQALKCGDSVRDDGVRGVGAEYARVRRTHVKFYQSVSHLLTPFYQSDSIVLPWLRDTFFEPVSKAPGMPSLITRLGAGMMFSPLTKNGL